MKKTFKKILAATLSAAMIFGGSVMTFADTVSPDALNAGGTEEKIEDLVNKKVYSVKLPTTTFVTNHFSNMKLDPQGLIAETSGDAYNNVSGIAVKFANIDSVTAGSILFRKEVAVSGTGADAEVTAVTYDTVSATLEAINCGTVPITVHAVTTISGLAVSNSTVQGSLALDADGKFDDANTSGAAIWLSVTGTSTYSNAYPSDPATSAAVALANTYSTTANTGEATVVQAVSGAPATVYAVTTVATTTSGETVKAYKYEPVAEVLSPVAAASEDGVSVNSAVSGMAVNFRHPAFGKFEFNMTGIANPNADYQAWKDYKDISLSLDIVWKIEYDDIADNRTVAEEAEEAEEAEDNNATTTDDYKMSAESGGYTYTFVSTPTGSLDAASFKIDGTARAGMVNNGLVSYSDGVFTINSTATTNLSLSSGSHTVKATIGGTEYTLTIEN